MYRLYELINTKWIDALDAETLQEIKEAILREKEREEVRHFRIDNGDVPITFCGTNDLDINGCFDTIERIDKSVMYTHNQSIKSLEKIRSSRPSRRKQAVSIPPKTTKKHKKKIMRSNTRKHSYYH